ncbi:hypothetical protein OSTOST_07256, partial [Ostertagia ostertagi]
MFPYCRVWMHVQQWNAIIEARVLARKRPTFVHVCWDILDGIAKIQCVNRYETATEEGYASARPTRSPASAISAILASDAKGLFERSTQFDDKTKANEEHRSGNAMAHHGALTKRTKMAVALRVEASGSF